MTPSYPYAQPPRKRRVWPWVAIPAALLFCLVGVIAAVASDTEPSTSAASTDSPGEIVGESGAKAAKSAAPKGKPAARTTIGGDDLVHVGEDIPPGTYRAVESIEGGLCYWKKSRDAEGTNIITNEIPTGGRPQVTLKKGQWFTSQGCPDWVAK